jgi:hypothetical protein
MTLPAGDALASAFVDLAGQPLAAERAWQQCFVYFGRGNTEFDPEQAALLLGFHLAGAGSFQSANGLRRCGSAALLPLVRIARNPEFADLRAIPVALAAEAAERIVALTEAMKAALSAEVSQIKLGASLLSKIALATLGCVPAYQRLQLKGARARGWRATFGEAGIAALVRAARDDADFRTFYESVERSRVRMANGDPYPPMRLLDAYLQLLGEEVVRAAKEQGPPIA